jgi:hypothetical protein
MAGDRPWLSLHGLARFRWHRHDYRSLALVPFVCAALLAMSAVLDFAGPRFTSLCSSSSICSLRSQLHRRSVVQGLPRHSHNLAAPSNHSPAPVTLKGLAASASGMATQAYKYRNPIVFNPREEHKGTVILLHGLGDTGDGWASIAAEFAPSMRHVKFIFPHAPLVRMPFSAYVQPKCQFGRAGRRTRV